VHTKALLSLFEVCGHIQSISLENFRRPQHVLVRTYILLIKEVQHGTVWVKYESVPAVCLLYASNPTKINCVFRLVWRWGVPLRAMPFSLSFVALSAWFPLSFVALFDFKPTPS
jgi:hypothetical protein